MFNFIQSKKHEFLGSRISEKLVQVEIILPMAMTKKDLASQEGNGE